MAYHPGCGGGQLAAMRPHTFLNGKPKYLFPTLTDCLSIFQNTIIHLTRTPVLKYQVIRSTCPKGGALIFKGEFAMSAKIEKFDLIGNLSPEREEIIQRIMNLSNEQFEQLVTLYSQQLIGSDPAYPAPHRTFA